jgi:hypothetical protein
MSSHGILYYDLDLDRARIERSFTLRFCSALSSEKGFVPVRSQLWRCKLPDPNVYVEDTFGTSETRGVFGGVSQPVLAAHSEAIERAIGDAMVLAFAQLLEEAPHVNTFLIRGPAFPKTLGRFLSLRPPDGTVIAWLMPLKDIDGPPLPALFSLNWYQERSVAWDSEALVNSFTHPESNPMWAVEFFAGGKPAETVRAIRYVLDNHIHKESGLPRDFPCARGLLRPPNGADFVFASGHIAEVPDWMEPQLVKSEVVSVPELEDTVGVARNLMRFPWRNLA